MKKMLALTLALIMVFALASTSVASAATAQFSTTQEFMDYCDRNGIKYEYIGFGTLTNGSRSSRESVDSDWSGDNVDSIGFRMSFEGDLSAVHFMCTVIEYNSYNKSALLDVVNNLNAAYYWVKFYCDSDNTVKCEATIPLRNGVAGELTFDTLYTLVQYVDVAYPQLAPYAK